MGQQQLLLVILVTIIVGIATVVAINTFGSASKNANKSAVRQDLATIASDAQGYYMKPKQLGGGGQDFTGMTFQKIGFGKESNITGGTVLANQNGTYTINAPTGSGTSAQVTVGAVPKQASTITLTATIGPNTFSVSQ